MCFYFGWRQCRCRTGGVGAGPSPAIERTTVAHDDRLIGIVETSRWGRPSASLILYAGHPPTAGTIRGLGHACVGRFWQGVALRLIERGEAPEVDGQIYIEGDVGSCIGDIVRVRLLQGFTYDIVGEKVS